MKMSLKTVMNKLFKPITVVIWVAVAVLIFFGSLIPIIGQFGIYIGLVILLGEMKYIGFDVMGWLNSLFSMYAKWREKMKF